LPAEKIKILMLKSLEVRNYVLIDSLEIDFPAGLVIITGQTGAGKSILLGALSLALGSKADPSMVGESGDSCVVEALFKSGDDPELKAVLSENDLDWNGGELRIRRVLNRSGRSRSFVNDEPVQVGVLQSLADRLIDIHSQHQTRLLTDRQFQLSLLDRFALAAPLAESCGESYRRLTGLKSKLSDLEDKLRSLSDAKDFNEDQLRRLEDAHLRDGEMEELEAEQKKLANAEEIKGVLHEAEQALDPDIDGSDGGMSVGTALREVSRLLSKVSAYIPQASELSERAESSRLEIDDILEEIRKEEENVEVSPERLQAVEDRMSTLYGLMKKHDVKDIAGLIAIRDSLSGSIEDTASLEEERTSLTKEIAAEEKHFAGICSELHSKRAEAAPKFSAEVEKLIRSLELEKAIFKAVVSPALAGPDGADSVRYLFSSTGKNPVDVAKCASGGEMSRIMLCLKAMMARFRNMPSLVFDEIDTGVSGSAADKMGSMICSMGKDMQIFAITHLPQVAAKGDAHYLVSKTTDVFGKDVTSIRKISGMERVEEIARMLSGSTVTPQAIANAKSLLS
jgi:DNA repair protein RecN (Recombination protein N)